MTKSHYLCQNVYTIGHLREENVEHNEKLK